MRKTNGLAIKEIFKKFQTFKNRFLYYCYLFHLTHCLMYKNIVVIFSESFFCILYIILYTQ